MKECEKGQHKFKWPASEDIDFDEFVKKVYVSVATSKAGRMLSGKYNMLQGCCFYIKTTTSQLAIFYPITFNKFFPVLGIKNA